MMNILNNVTDKKKKVIFIKDFQDIGKIISYEKLILQVYGYECFDTGFLEIIKSNVVTKKQPSILEIYSKHLGLLNYHGFLPSVFRDEIIYNKQTNELFRFMHSIFFQKYMESFFIQRHDVYWQNFLNHLYMTDTNVDNMQKTAGRNQQSTFYLKDDHISSYLSNTLSMNHDKNINMSKNHIFKFLKQDPPKLGIFQINKHTIGSHYYTSMCTFINFKVNSSAYYMLVNNLAQIKSKLALSAPEIKLILYVKIIDSKHLKFKLGIGQLSLTSWILNQKVKNINIKYENIIL